MQQLFRLFILIMAFSSVSIALENQSNILQPYSKAVFNKAISDGKTIVLHFHTDWCGVCHRQMKILNNLLKNDKYNKVVALQADFDSSTRSKEESQLLKRLNITSRSTILYFKGEQRVYEISNIKNVSAMVDEKSIEKALDMLVSSSSKTSN